MIQKKLPEIVEAPQKPATFMGCQSCGIAALTAIQKVKNLAERNVAKRRGVLRKDLDLQDETVASDVRAERANIIKRKGFSDERSYFLHVQSKALERLQGQSAESSQAQDGNALAHNQSQSSDNPLAQMNMPSS